MIADVGSGLDDRGRGVLDAEGCVVTPGLVDIQVHFREPGREEAETIETGARAAALGGYTAILAMPNTDPPLDDAGGGQLGARAGRRPVGLRRRVAGCITKGRHGHELAPMGELYDLGVRVFTDDGDCVADARVMRRALEYAGSLPGAVVAQHAEDASLCAGGHMHEGEWSSRLGIPGRPAVAESSIVARDLELLAELTGTPLHVLHCLDARHRRAGARREARGCRVTAECAPQHFTLTDEACSTFDPVFKMNPPLRTAADVEGIIAGLVDGTIDAIATDHAPHAPETKEHRSRRRARGCSGSRPRSRVTLTELVEPGVICLAGALALLSWRPARVAGLDGPRRPGRPGRPAHLVVIDPARHVGRSTPPGWRAGPRNSPYAGRTLTGRVRHTVRRGDPVVVDGEAHPMSGAACSCSPTAPPSRASWSQSGAAAPVACGRRARSCSTPRCRVTRRS